MLFTIAIPAFKRKFLKEAVQSCLDQSFRDFELVILDDDSPEHLSAVLDSFDDPRVRKFKNEKNVGAVDVVNNWNKCLGLARGEYFICMGDDDVLLPHCLEQYESIIRRFPEVNLFHMRTQIINEDSEVVSTKEERPEQEDVCTMILERWNGRSQYVGDYCYKTSSLKESGGFLYLPLAWGSDDITAVRAALSRGVVNCNITGFQYRENRYSISSSNCLAIKLEATLQEAAWYRSNFTPPSPVAERIGPTFRKKCEDYIYEALMEQPDYSYWLQKARQAHIPKIKYDYIFLKAYLKRAIKIK